MKEKILALEKIVNNQKDDDLKQPIKSVNANTNLTQDKLININSLSSKKDMKKKKKKVEKQASKVSIEKFNSLLIGEQQYFISYLYDQQKSTFSDSINLLLFLIGTIGDEVKFVSFQKIQKIITKTKI